MVAAPPRSGMANSLQNSSSTLKSSPSNSQWNPQITLSILTVLHLEQACKAAKVRVEISTSRTFNQSPNSNQKEHRRRLQIALVQRSDHSKRPPSMPAEPFRQNQDTTSDSFGCISVKNFKEDTRPVMDKKYNSILVNKLADVDTVTRYSPYAISMMQAQNLLPVYDPPSLPAKFRQVSKRNGKDTGKEATWVISHLCHNKMCVNAGHLCWEPSWMNRLRDNCPGGDLCVHRPNKCLRAHRPVSNEELIDWTEYVDAGVD